jgi:hypothetical protein
VTEQRQRSGLDDLFQDIEAARREQKPRWRRWLRRGLLLLVGVLVLAFLLSIPPAIGAASDLLDARADLVTGREALVSGDVTSAERAFGRARESFAGASGDMENPAVRVISWLPLVGRTPDAVTAVAQSGELVAQAGLELARSGEGLPGQVSALAPRGGRIPLEPMRQLAPGLERAADLLGRADEIMRESPDHWIPGPVGDPRYEFATQVAEAHRIVDGAAELARTLPAFLGGEDRRRYLVGAQNPAELRGTGGFIGAYAIMEARQGRIELGPFRPIIQLTSTREPGVEPPNRDFERIYGRYGGAGLMHNINMTPSFPSAAVAIEHLYEKVKGERLDGVIVADPHALAALMEVTGSAKVPGLDVTVNADNLVPYLTNEAYSQIGHPEIRKRLLGDVAGEVLRRFLTTSAAADPAAAGRGLAQAAGEGHLLLHSTDPSVQSAFRQARIAGGLTSSSGDYLNVVVNNLGVNKVDYYVDREVTYDVDLLPSGQGAASATVRFKNNAPRRGQPRYVIGPHEGVSAVGESVALTSLYCAPGCSVREVRHDGVPVPLSLENELGHPMVRSVVGIPSGATGQVEHGLHLAKAWDRTDGYGVYRLTFQNQPTIQPTLLEVRVRAPEGMAITRTEPEMDVEGTTATWRGEPADLQTFEVSFARSLPWRIWSAIWDFLNQPLLEP